MARNRTENMSYDRNIIFRKKLWKKEKEKLVEIVVVLTRSLESAEAENRRLQDALNLERGWERSGIIA